jgi:glucokinase
MTTFQLGIDLGGTNTTLGFVTRQGRVVACDHFSTEASKGPRDWSGRACRKALEMMDLAGIKPGAVQGAGIGAAGLIDQETGRILQSPNFKGWVRVPAARLLARKLRIPVAIDNDVNAMALGEALFGGGRGLTDVFCIALGTGVGGGLFLKGEIYRGTTYSAGEIGHVTIDPDGPFCACGNQGCLEAFVGTAGILRTADAWIERNPRSKMARFASKHRLTVKDVADLAKSGCSSARDVLKHTGMMLGIGLAGVVNLLNPSAIIVGGRVAQAGRFLFRPLRETLKRRAMSVPRRAVQVRPAQLGPRAGMIGASMLPLGYARIFR